MRTIPPHGAGFAGAPVQTGLTQIDAAFAYLGIPYGVPYGMDDVAPPSATAAAAVRRVAEQFIGYLPHYDFDIGGPVLEEGEMTIADAGDVPGDPYDLPATAVAATRAVADLLERGAVPLVVGGDHSIPPLVLAAYQGRGPIDVVHVDAHLDFRDEVLGVAGGYSSPIRRLREMPWVRTIVQVGLRGPGSARPQEVEAALAAGNVLVTADEVHEHGVAPVLEHLDSGAPVYVTVDIDGIDPGAAPAATWPAPGGLTYVQMVRLLRGIVSRGPLAGMDVCEFAPARDVNDLTGLFIARLFLVAIGATHLCGGATSGAGDAAGARCTYGDPDRQPDG
jgi:agmatinase